MALPALCPPCHVFKEVGTVIVTSENDENLLGVSADGVIECCNNYTNCEYNCTEENEVKCIPVEVKCPFNRDNPFYDKYYSLPERYVPQITSEIFAYKADFCILATKTEDSVVFKKLILMITHGNWKVTYSLISTVATSGKSLPNSMNLGKN